MERKLANELHLRQVLGDPSVATSPGSERVGSLATFARWSRRRSLIRPARHVIYRDLPAILSRCRDDLPAKDHFGEMRAGRVRDALIYCRDHRYSDHVETNADGCPPCITAPVIMATAMAHSHSFLARIHKNLDPTSR